MRNFILSGLLFFAIPVSLLAQAPVNDDPCNATELTVNSACSFITANLNDQSTPTTGLANPSCNGGFSTGDGDIWFKATVPANGILKVTTQPGDITDGAMAFYTGTCNGTLTEIFCDRNSAPGSGSMPEITATGLTPGSTIFIRFWENNFNDFGNFEICATSIQSPDNDEPCGAILLNVANTCNNITGTNVNASATTGVPDPVCLSGNGNYAGGDVWYKAVVPANGHLFFITSPGSLTNGGLALYKGTCNALQFIACETTQGPGEMGEMSFVNLTPGDTIWARVWEEGNNVFGDFSICVTSNPIASAPVCNINTAAGASCATATSICSLDGYCGNTISFGATFWPELNTEFKTCIGNTNPGVIIQNNSFLKFTAAATSAQFKVWVTSTTKGIGIQMMFFETNTCGSGPVVCHGGYDDIRPGPEKLITATGLIPGNTYYLMVDGVSNDQCNYVIGAVNGLSSLSVSSSASAICNGQPVTLNASGFGSTYTWTWTNTAGPQTFTGATLTDNPTQTTNYLLTASGTGICSGTQNVLVTVNDNPTATVNSPSVCTGNTTTITATPSPAGSYNYAWTVPAGATNPGNVASFNSAAGGAYSVVVTNPTTNCFSTASIGTISLLAVPTVTVNSPAVCVGNAATINATTISPDPVSYAWTFPSGVTDPGNVSSFNTTNAGTYSVVATNSVTNCPSASASGTVTINALPTASVTSNNGPVCSGNTGTFTLSGTPGATVSYTINGSAVNTSTINGTGTGTISLPGVTSDQVIALASISDATCSQTLSNTSTLTVTPVRTPSFAAWGPYCQNDITPTVTLPSTSIEGINGIWNPASVSTANVGTTIYTFTPVAGQCAQPTTMSVVVNPLPSGVTAGPSFTINNGGSVTLQGGGTGSIYTWTPATNLSNPGIANPIANPSTTTIYTLTVENGFGCKEDDSLIVTVVANCVEPSKIFTPNNDGLYDNWIAYTGSCVKMVEANVYDRNGNLVYHSADYKNNWNGTRNSKPLPDATYYYVLKITDINGLTYVRKGSVAIIR